jgi:hypothetical protein
MIHDVYNRIIFIDEKEEQIDDYLVNSFPNYQIGQKIEIKHIVQNKMRWNIEDSDNIYEIKDISHSIETRYNLNNSIEHHTIVKISKIK